MRECRSKFVWIFLFVAFTASGQQKSMTYSALAKDLAGPAEELEYINVSFENDLEADFNNRQDLSKPDLFNTYLRKLLKVSTDGYYPVKKRIIYFENCIFGQDLVLKKLQFEGVVTFFDPGFPIGKSTTPLFAIDSCKFNNALWLVSHKPLQTLIVSNTSINQQFFFDIDEVKSARIEYSKFTFNDSTIQEPFRLTVGSIAPAFNFSFNTIEHHAASTSLGGFMVYSGFARIDNSKIFSANRAAPFSIIAANTSIKSLILKRNHFDVDVFLYPPVDVDLQLTENRFNRKLGWEYTGLAPSSTIDWETIPISQFGFYTKIESQITNYPDSLFFNARNDSQLDQTRRVKRLLKLHKGIYDLYKLAGDLESANAAYIVIRDLETRYLERIQENKPSFENYIKIKLNHLLRFYSLYATSPARAIIVSIWVIVGFAVFYFFFPSTWDISSKSKLIQNFKDFAQKNDKGYVKPFFTMLFGFIISVLNALTLSLNSFVTLGFGEIPTKGLARYITILQGFIGWFLLSIFTVAVINQAIF